MDSIYSKLVVALYGLLFLWTSPIAAQPPVPVSRCDCPCSETCSGTLTPCEYEIVFTSFTHDDGPSIDKKAKLFFEVDIVGLGAGYPTQYYNYVGVETGEGVTRSVNKIVHSILVPCNTFPSFELEIHAIEYDLIGGDDEGTSSIPITLGCSDFGPQILLEDKSVTMNLNNKHDVTVNFQIVNKAPFCYENPDTTCPNPPPPPGYDDTPKPCNVTLEAVGITHIQSSTSLDSTGEFSVTVTTTAPGGTTSTTTGGQYYVPVQSSKPLDDMGILFNWEIPCCDATASCIEVPIKISITEADPFINDLGVLEDTITICCPLKNIEGEVYKYNIDVLGRRGKGKLRHKVEVTLVVKTTTSSVCVKPPLPPKERPCEIQYTLLDIENTFSPGLDKNAEFSFWFTIDGVLTELNYWTSFGVVRKNERVIVNKILHTLDIPCGEKRIVPLSVEAIEYDRDFSIPWLFTIENVDEYAQLSDSFEVECRPDPEVVIRTYELEFKNSKGNVRHRAKIRIEERLINWSLACECTDLSATTVETCDMEVALQSFEHDEASPGDNNADFTFTFWFNSQEVSLIDTDRSVDFDNVDKGDVVVLSPVDEFVDFGVGALDSNLLGTYFNNFIRVPVGAFYPVRVDVYGTEYNFGGGDEYGFATTEFKISCNNNVEPISLRIELKKKNKKVKHFGILTLVVGPA